MKFVFILVSLVSSLALALVPTSESPSLTPVERNTLTEKGTAFVCRRDNDKLKQNSEEVINSVVYSIKELIEIQSVAMQSGTSEKCVIINRR